MFIYILFHFFSYAFHEPWPVSHETASSSGECSRDKPPFSFVRGQDSTMWDIVWVSPQGHHFLLQALQCPCSVRKRLSRDHCCQGRSKPGCRIVGSHTRWELITWADFQLSLHRLLTSIKTILFVLRSVCYSNGQILNILHTNTEIEKIKTNLSFIAAI